MGSVVCEDRLRAEVLSARWEINESGILAGGFPLRLGGYKTALWLTMQRFGFVTRRLTRFWMSAAVAAMRRRKRLLRVMAGELRCSQITGVARSTIGRGLAELRSGAAIQSDRVRKPGGGRKSLTAKDPTLLDDLRSLVEPSTRGDPQAPLLWSAKSLRNLAAGLQELGHRISYSVVAELLGSLGYRLQANRKTREGRQSPRSRCPILLHQRAGEGGPGER